VYLLAFKGALSIEANENIGPCASVEHRALNPKAKTKLAQSEIVEMACRHFCVIRSFACATERFQNVIALLYKVCRMFRIERFYSDVACKFAVWGRRLFPTFFESIVCLLPEWHKNSHMLRLGLLIHLCPSSTSI
jgi:hypothetical protein